MIGETTETKEREELAEQQERLRKDELLDEALRESFPASDPPAVAIDE